jgi:3-methyladenine DNA glycosylase AlkC
LSSKIGISQKYENAGMHQINHRAQHHVLHLRPLSCWFFTLPVSLLGFPVKQDGKKVNKIQKKMQQGHKKPDRTAKKPTEIGKIATGKQKSLQDN